MTGFVLGLIVVMMLVGLLIHYWRQVLAFVVVFIVSLTLTTIFYVLHHAMSAV